jgi:hypothetical protein
MADIIKPDDSKLVQTIAELYSLYTGQEIADAHRIIRQRLNLVAEIKQKKQTIRQLQTELEELEDEHD